MIALLNVHYAHAGQLVAPDVLATNPAVPIEYYRDSFGNWCSRFTAPAGRFSIGTDGMIEVDPTPDPAAPGAQQHAIEDLPADTLQFLLGSRYCETDRLSDEAWRLFGETEPGWARVQAICDYVHDYVTFGYEYSNPTKTGADVYYTGVGVCRDFTHLAVTLCRCLNIPTRYCTGYISDVGEISPTAPMDFCAWMEVYLDGQWWTFDPRNNRPRIGRVLIARGRDASDVPLTHTFGMNRLSGFDVWIYPIAES